MSVIIIIGGSGRARAAIDAMNQTASTNHWTQAQKDNAAAILNAFADEANAFTANPQPPA
jgi:hypothetical protein